MPQPLAVDPLEVADDLATFLYLAEDTTRGDLIRRHLALLDHLYDYVTGLASVPQSGEDEADKGWWACPCGEWNRSDERTCSACATEAAS